MDDIGLSAFSLFFMGSASFLDHQRRLEEGHGRSNCQTLFGMSKIPTDPHIRQMPDGVPTEAFDPVLREIIGIEGVPDPFKRPGGRIPIALEGTEQFCSRKIHCPRCSTRKRSDGGGEYFHAFPGASIVAPGPRRVLPPPREFITPQDGADKQDCERNAARRWLARHGPALKPLRPVFPGGDLFACQPIAAAIRRAGGAFILTCKPSSHQTTTVIPGKGRVTTLYRWLAGVPMRAADDAIEVTWFSIEIRNAKGKKTYSNSFITDLTVTGATVAEIAACGRSRRKIENKTFNVLKTNGYNPGRNSGHGKETLASVLVTLNRLAFGFHAAARLALLAWRKAVIARGAAYRFFEHLRTITPYVVFESRDPLLRSIEAAAIRPP